MERETWTCFFGGKIDDSCFGREKREGKGKKGDVCEELWWYVWKLFGINESNKNIEI